MPSPVCGKDEMTVAEKLILLRETPLHVVISFIPDTPFLQRHMAEPVDCCRLSQPGKTQTAQGSGDGGEAGRSAGESQ